MLNARHHNNESPMPEFFWWPVIVGEVHSEHIITIHSERIPLIEKRLQGIPLTEEWLLKFGFEEMEFENCFSINYAPFEFKVELLPKEDFIIFKNRNENTHHAQCKYVHQLQNLYFALTGEELTITSPEIINT